MSLTSTDQATARKFNLVVLIALLIAVFSGTPFALQNDTFYTIKLGERILSEGLIPIDTFVWHEDILYTYPHWLYTVFIYKIYELGGFFAIYLSSAMFGYLLGLVLYFTYLNLYKNYFVAFLIAVTVISMLSNNFTARAQSVTYILFALQIFCIEKTLIKNQLRYYVGLIAISTLIVNLHLATWFLFFILFLPYFAEYIIACFIKPNPSADMGYKLDRVTLTKHNSIKGLFIVFIICLFTGLLSPLGDTPYTYLYKTYQGVSVNFISEHQPLIPFINPHFLLFLSAIGILLTFTKVKLRTSDIFMVGGLLLLSLMSIRQTLLFYIVCGYFLCRITTEFFDNNNKERVNFYINKIATVKGGVIALIFITLLSANRLLALPKQYDADYPVKAVEYIKSNLDLDTMRIYAPYFHGSYLIYNDIKVFIDSRADLYTIQFNGKDDIFQDAVDLYKVNRNYRDIMEKYPFTHFLLTKNETLYFIFKDDPAFKELYSDDGFILYEWVK